MKQFLILILICFAQNIYSQHINEVSVKHLPSNGQAVIEEEDNQIYTTAGLEVKPEFPGGINELYKFINANFKRPKESPQLKGNIFLSFIIEKDGSLTNFTILKDLGYNTGNEAIRVLKLAPKWIPGNQNLQKVRVSYAIPIPLT